MKMKKYFKLIPLGFLIFLFIVFLTITFWANKRVMDVGEADPSKLSLFYETYDDCRTQFKRQAALLQRQFKDVEISNYTVKSAVDADLSTSNLGLQLGFYQFPLGLQDALDGNIGILNAIYTHPSGLRVVPASISLNFLNKNPTPYRLKSVLSDLNGIILIDSPPGLRGDALLVLKACDELVVVTNPAV